jgi:hypothetical protein
LQIWNHHNWYCWSHWSIVFAVLLTICKLSEFRESTPMSRYVKVIWNGIFWWILRNDHNCLIITNRNRRRLSWLRCWWPVISNRCFLLLLKSTYIHYTSGPTLSNHLNDLVNQRLTWKRRNRSFFISGGTYNRDQVVYCFKAF